MTTDEPVTEIQGVGPVTADRLAALGVERVGDLAHRSPQALHDAVADIASPAEVVSWRSMAALMAVAGVDGPRAEALWQAGIDTVEALADAAYDDLAAAFRTAVAAGRLADEPGAADCLALARSANRILLGGAAMGTVRDRDGNPIAGAVVEVAEGRAATDGAGRFRILGLRPAPRYGCRVLVDGQPVFVSAAFPVVFDAGVVGGPDLVVGAPLASTLDEFDGAALPPTSGLVTRTRRFAGDALRDGDVVIVTSLYVTTPRAKVVSIFRAVEAGELVVRYAGVPVDSFAAGPPAVGETFRHRAGVLRKVAGGPGALEMHRANRRAMAEWAGLGETAAAMTLEESFAWHGQALRRHNVLAARDVAGLFGPSAAGESEAGDD